MPSIDPALSTGLTGLDQIIRGLMPGDNLVWQIKDIDDYIHFVDHACRHAARRRQQVIYFRFATHKPLMTETEGVVVCKLRSEEGFAPFIEQINQVINKNRNKALYIFDCLSELVGDWSSDRMLGNFFMLTCPHLYDVGAIAYFALLRDHHSFHATGPISNTTQILIDIYRHEGRLYVHPVKVLHRNSPTMYMLHAWDGETFSPVTQSLTASRILSGLPWNRSDVASYHLGYWSSNFTRADKIQADIEAGNPTPPDLEDFTEHLRHMMISSDPKILDLARRYLPLKNIVDVRRRMIGTGLIGGKSAGMLLARAILEKTDPSWKTILEPDDSFFIGSDVFCSYLVQNGCWWTKQEKREPQDYLEGAMRVRQQIMTGTFPEYLLKQFSAMLEYFGQSPIIVRSSSLMEDAFGNSFAGKYDSVFCANQGSPDKRMADFLSAVRTVYASVMSEGALLYRASRGLLDRDEQMALLIQRVSGSTCGQRFLPQAAGVAFSFNPYVWSDYIDPHAGVTRIVFGLGTRAVDRSDDDYTRIVALNAPERRPETDSDEVRKHTQHKVDFLDLEANQEVSTAFENIVKDSKGIPIEMFASRDEDLERRAAERNMKGVFPWVLTFNKLLKETDFVRTMRQMLTTLQDVYQHPVDIEYTLNFFEENRFNINLVQCRPLHVKGGGEISDPPENIPACDVFLKTQGPVIGQSRIIEIDRLIYVVPSVYGQLPTYDRYAVARVIGRLTHRSDARDRKTMIMGPGRWGSTTPALGVPVSFAEINTVEVLCEIVAMREDLVPDVSLGTHFFSELVELDMLYLALFPDREGVILNTEFIEQSENKFLSFLPDEQIWNNVIRVIDLSEAGSKLVVNANAIKQRVSSYIQKS